MVTIRAGFYPDHYLIGHSCLSTLYVGWVYAVGYRSALYSDWSADYSAYVGSCFQSCSFGTRHHWQIIIIYRYRWLFKPAAYWFIYFSLFIIYIYKLLQACWAILAHFFYCHSYCFTVKVENETHQDPHSQEASQAAGPSYTKSVPSYSRREFWSARSGVAG